MIPVSLGASIPSSSSTSSTVPSDTSSGHSTGTKIGIAVGAGVGGIALIGLIAGLLLYRRRKSNAYRQADTKDTHAFEIGSSTEYSEAEGKSAVPPSYAMFDGRNSEPSEMEGRAISEIDGEVKHKRDGADPVELP
jgi:LPXTG-motif cell wall-anchored protein